MLLKNVSLFCRRTAKTSESYGLKHFFYYSCMPQVPGYWIHWFFMLKHVHMVICFYKNTNASRFCVAILNKRGLDHNMTQFNTKEQAALLLPLCESLGNLHMIFIGMLCQIFVWSDLRPHSTLKPSKPMWAVGESFKSMISSCLAGTWDLCKPELNASLNQLESFNEKYLNSQR